jgi:hypothetical protein
MSPNRYLVVVPSGVSKTISSLWYVQRKLCTYLASILTLSPNGPKRGSTWPESPRCSVGCFQSDFLSLWYVQCKPCTYLVSKLALSLNGPKGHSTWASSPRSTIGCVQNDFSAYGMFGTNYGPIFLRHKHYLHMYRNNIPIDPCHLGIRSGASKTILSLWYVRRKPCTYLASPNGPILIVSKRTKTRFHMTHVT